MPCRWRGNLILMDNGNLRASRNDQPGVPFALQLFGGRTAQYVAFGQRESEGPVSRVAGRDFFDGVKRQIDAFGLHSQLHE